MKVGFIGLGNMGQPTARHLREAGHELAVYNRSRERAEPPGGQGAVYVSSSTLSGETIITGKTG